MLDKIVQKIKNLIPKKKPTEEKKVEPQPAAAASTPPSATSGKPPLDEKAKRKQLIIKIVAGIVVVYVALDEFVFKKETVEETPKPVVSSRKHERKPKKSLKEFQKPTEEAAKRDVTSIPTTKTPEVPPTPPPPATEVVPEQPKVSPTAAEVSPSESTPIPPPQPEAEAVTTETPSTEAPAEAETPPPTSETQITPEAAGTAAEKPTEEITQNMEKVAEEVGPIPTEEIKPAEKVELPDYSIKGRGLVYNCKGKHWACIDREGYLNCREHMRWSEENKKSPECAVKSVYASEEDCAVVQLYYININEPSDFCQKN